MSVISAGQIKMARALLEWSQEDLAEKTRLSISTIRSMELGFAPRPSTAREIRSVIENAGLEFTDGEGVRRRFDLEFYNGSDSCEKLLDDMLKTVAQKGGGIAGFVRSQEMMLQSLGIFQRDDLYRMERLCKTASIKCVLSESAVASFAMPPIQFRLIAEPSSSASYFYVYGNKHVMILPRDNGCFQFVVLALAHQAESYQKHFQALWDQALPVSARSGKK
ncbi:MAG: helix-turn-helix transcriptional regulator [Candidatus Obscuribacterales bacterium]|nr:helix-turn-helix transcriptional regulator [Candidatus Obscuribacterales bacterium]